MKSNVFVECLLPFQGVKRSRSWTQAGRGVFFRRIVINTKNNEILCVCSSSERCLLTLWKSFFFYLNARVSLALLLSLRRMHFFSFHAWASTLRYTSYASPSSNTSYCPGFNFCFCFFPTFFVVFPQVSMKLPLSAWTWRHSWFEPSSSNCTIVSPTEKHPPFVSHRRFKSIADTGHGVLLDEETLSSPVCPVLERSQLGASRVHLRNNV